MSEVKRISFKDNERVFKDWRYLGRKFLVQVVRSTTPPVIERTLGYVEQRWMLYVYIYPEHPLFDRLVQDKSVANVLDLHQGCNYIKVHWDNEGKNITSIQLGCDFNHSHDCLENAKDKESDREVFLHAESLYNRLFGDFK